MLNIFYILCEKIGGVEKHRHFFVLDAITMVVRLILTTQQSKNDALLKIAEEDLCNPSDQAHFLLREELVFGNFIISENMNDGYWDDSKGGVVN